MKLIFYRMANDFGMVIAMSLNGTNKYNTFRLIYAAAVSREIRRCCFIQPGYCIDPPTRSSISEVIFC